jgi:hypothetical protein
MNLLVKRLIELSNAYNSHEVKLKKLGDVKKAEIYRNFQKELQISIDFLQK